MMCTMVVTPPPPLLQYVVGSCSPFGAHIRHSPQWMTSQPSVELWGILDLGRDNPCSR